MLLTLSLSPDDPMSRQLVAMKQFLKQEGLGGCAGGLGAIGKPGGLLYSYDRAAEYSFQAELPFQQCEAGAKKQCFCFQNLKKKSVWNSLIQKICS